MHARLHTATAKVLDQLCVLIRQVALCGVDSSEVNDAVESLREALQGAEPPFTLQFFHDAILRDRMALDWDLERQRRCQQLVGALLRLGAQELAIDELPTPEALARLCAALLEASHTSRSSLPKLAGMRLCRLVRIGAPGTTPDVAALEVFLTAQLGQLCGAARELSARSGDVWDWAAGRAFSRRLERCLTSSVTVTGCVLETAALPWTRERRCVAAVLHAGAVLARLQVSPFTQRAAAHAMLALAVHGLRERAGVPLHEAAGSALARLIEAEHAPNGEPDPHRLRVCALVSACAKRDGGSSTSHPLVPLLFAAYELERRRAPEDLDFYLGAVDLQAWLAEAMGHEIQAEWGRALLGALGLVPVGSYVLADGKLGVVMGASDTGDAARPSVLSGGRLGVARQALALHSPFGMTPWAR